MGAGFGTLLGNVLVPTALSVAGRKAGAVVAKALQPAQEPTPPIAPVAAPQAPQVATAPEITKAEPEAVIDTEAAKVRARKRRTQQEQSNLFSLTQSDDAAVVLTKSLLGE